MPPLTISNPPARPAVNTLELAGARLVLRLQAKDTAGDNVGEAVEVVISQGSAMGLRYDAKGALERFTQTPGPGIVATVQQFASASGNAQARAETVLAWLATQGTVPA